MKKLWIILLSAAFALPASAQFTKARLQATGLTCAMCSNAINKALLQVPFIDTVMSDIKNSAFDIVFRENETVDIDAVQKAVEEAGFSVGSLKVTGVFNKLPIGNDKHVSIGPSVFHFLEVKSTVLDGEQTLTVIDKDFVTAKEFKKVSHYSKMDCLKTGKASSCCVAQGIGQNERIYHVTI